jgi:hypothetical protein
MLPTLLLSLEAGEMAELHQNQQRRQSQFHGIFSS